MDLRVKQSKIILKNYLFFASKYICCCFTLDAKNIFENEFYSRMYVKKIEKWRIIDENNAFSTIVSREKGIYRYNDAIWRKYRNYTISFLTTRQFKRRIESPTILSSIQSMYIFQISSIDLLFVHRTTLLHCIGKFHRFPRNSWEPTIRFISHSNNFSNKIQRNTKLFIVTKSIDQWRDLEVDLKN